MRAARPGRRTLGDLLVLLWVVVWLGVGRAVHAQVMRLAEPGRTVEEAGRSLGDGLAQAGETVARAPFLGRELQAPFDAAGEAAARLAGAGVAVQDGVSRTALVTALAVAGWPIVVVVGAWALHRWRGARRAAVARRLLARPDGVDLLALRALAAAPLDQLAALGPDVAGAWRRGDPDVTRGLATVALAELGVAPVSPPRT
ncbi:hypothetical protein [Cellulomonas aerilata]|uniref:hypothetical protein n=1 Tax=Cellulomonas aerilata TaxID=515326 RepID=UPI0011BEFCD3|nr:hypothetical protein [Cellulomonas aerilata]